jgi:preprotein translocase SecE subunit
MEMKKVTTPSFKEVRATTMVVIIAVAIFGVYFFVVDRVIGTGMTYLLNYFK